MANVYIAEGIVYMAASYRDAGRVGDAESIKGIWRPNQGMWQTGILLGAGDAESIKGIWRPDPGNVADRYIARGG